MNLKNGIQIYIKRTHNCYAYALNLIDIKQANICEKYMKITNKHDCPMLRPQPGQLSGYRDEFTPSPVTCKKIEERMMKDNPLIKKLKLNEECPDNFYKIALVSRTKKNNSDYHFYRQDNNGLWSHKDGWKLATNKDAKGKLIRSPETANRGYYNIFCGYYAVNATRTSSYFYVILSYSILFSVQGDTCFFGVGMCPTFLLVIPSP